MAEIAENNSSNNWNYDLLSRLFSRALVAFIKPHQFKPYQMPLNIFDSTNPIEHQNYFHGILQQKEIDKILKNNGDFVVRITKTDDELKYILSVFWTNQRHHYVMTRGTDEKWHSGKNRFDNLEELIYYFYTSNVPIVPNGPVLLTPRPRKEWEIHNDQITLLHKIGSGAFGAVYLGTLTVDGGEMTVAVKRCHQSLDDKQKLHFLEEGTLMRRLDHPNIVKLIAIAATMEPVMIVMEYIDGGSLQSYLTNNKSRIPTVLCLKFCLMAVKRMDYLQTKKCIHRDLAARNCLITKRKHLKITDFCPAIQGARTYLANDDECVPVRWMSPESIETGLFTFKSDVWSFGVLMWEIYSEGDMPYSRLNVTEAAHAITAGQQLRKPKKMPALIADQIRSCWKNEEDRIDFHNLKTKLVELYDDDLNQYSQKPKSRKKTKKRN